jgi:hypothetical protein
MEVTMSPLIYSSTAAGVSLISSLLSAAPSFIAVDAVQFMIDISFPGSCRTTRYFWRFVSMMNAYPFSSGLGLL